MMMSVTRKTTNSGTIYYHNKQGQLHREDGPAILYSDGDHEWWWCGKIHRFDGPAFFMHSKNVYRWYIKGTRVREEEYVNWLKNNGMDINNLTDDDKMFILMAATPSDYI